MSTDYQRAREELGRRLRELRLDGPEGRLTGVQLAQRLGWRQSKVSKLENGRQTPTDDDLRAWTEAVGQPAVFTELRSRLKGFESHVRSWRRQLAAGHAPVQETWNTLVSNSATQHALSTAAINGMLQTADYARHVFERHATLRQSPRDTDAAVRARLKRQEWLYRPGKRLNVLMPESVLWGRICPPDILAAQLDRLLGVVGMDTVNLGILPLDGALPLTVGNSFNVLDERLVVVEDWHAELWLDDAETIALYRRVWDTFAESAVYGAEAQQVIARVRRSIKV
ncbi:helix-turn-helix domain-containing protein [Streptomyces sp. NPDC088760]|uniref:helix-turn-helix domain-containing protein n=1 Tax=Streptomyces sp. NPDC088760 TaxID=3365890 RepID=UPI00380FF880